MKKLILTAILFLFIWNVSGVQYQTSMIDEDLSKDFEIEGWVLSENSNQTEVTVKYYIEFVNPNYDRTEPASFNLNLIDGEHLIAQKELGFNKLDLGKNVSGIATISSERPPDRISELEFRSNHTLFKESGNNKQTVSSAQIEFTPSKIDPEITSVESSTSIAKRSQNISLKAYTNDIENLSVDGNKMRENNDFFSGNVEIPRDIDAGETSINYDFKTGRGAKFTESIDITLNNEPPTINLSVNNSVPKGNPVKVKTDIEDDREIANTSLIFDGESYELENGEATIETIQLYPGEYTLEIRVVDSDGAYSTKTETINIYREQAEEVSKKQNTTTDKEVKDDSKETEKKKDSSEKDNSQEENSDTEDDYRGFNEIVVEPVKDLVMSLIKKIPF